MSSEEGAERIITPVSNKLRSSIRKRENYREQRLEHREEAEKFYRDLVAQGVGIRVGMEASGHARWFERLMADLNLELWSAMQRRSAANEYASRRPITRTHG